VLIQPEHHPAVYGPVAATPERPVENQYVVAPSSYISGKVVGPDGAPVAHAAVGWVTPVNESGHPIDGLELGRMTNTADDGTFRLGPLAQGTFRITSVIDNPRRQGRVVTHANVSNAVIRIELDERK
jgi:hypothetical protein